jgi:hypothetical protein
VTGIFIFLGTFSFMSVPLQYCVFITTALAVHYVLACSDTELYSPSGSGF